jgi:hypothetical protein
LIAADELSRHIRIFNWETVRPTAVFRKLVREEATPFVGLAVRSRPPLSAQGDGSAHVHGCGHLADRPMQRFVRNREQLAAPPVGLALDESAVEQLAQLVSHWAAAALAQPS